MDGISKIADAVGGIEVTLDTSIPGVGSKGKTVTLKGSKAETYLRDRHNSSGSDFGRTTHQRDFIVITSYSIHYTKLYDCLRHIEVPLRQPACVHQVC